MELFVCRDLSALCHRGDRNPLPVGPSRARALSRSRPCGHQGRTVLSCRHVHDGVAVDGPGPVNQRTRTSRMIARAPRGY